MYRRYVKRDSIDYYVAQKGTRQYVFIKDDKIYQSAKYREGSVIELTLEPLAIKEELRVNNDIKADTTYYYMPKYDGNYTITLYGSKGNSDKGEVTKVVQDLNANKQYEYKLGKYYYRKRFSKDWYDNIPAQPTEFNGAVALGGNRGGKNKDSDSDREGYIVIELNGYIDNEGTFYPSLPSDVIEV